MKVSERTVRSGPRHIDLDGVKVSLVAEAQLSERARRVGIQSRAIRLTPFRVFVISEAGVRRLEIRQAYPLRVAGALALLMLGPAQFWLDRWWRRNSWR